jgi:uncharacterized protein
MPGERDLNALLATMQPLLAQERFVFVTGVDDSLAHRSVTPVMTFREREGATWIVTEAEAAALGLTGSYPCRMITLNVHSSLEAIGFLAAITTALASHGISMNAVSAFYHDHLFVPVDKAAEALSILQALSVQARRSLTA